ncbi:MAG: AAA family ATPase [Planctomycetota bacterium]|nr:AAA family ATPase [Planctomycetota bacterium]
MHTPKDPPSPPAEPDSLLRQLQVRAASTDLPAALRTSVEHELRHLAAIPAGSDQATRSRAWLGWVLELPIGPNQPPPRSLSFDSVVRQLDRSLAGLHEVKQRIVEHLAVRKLGGHGRGTVLCFVGPPGTGKTSMGRAIAAALGRELIEINAGALARESDLCGTPHHLASAQPGAILAGIHRSGSARTVLLVDEIDNIAFGSSGDSAGALARVLDRDQNDEFHDRYLGQPYDLSGCVFLATASEPEAIPPRLLDRLEIIEFGSYTEDEKVAIARGHLIPRARSWAGLEPGQLRISPAALRGLIRQYTSEPGIRGLGRQLEALARKAALAVVTEERSLSIRREDLFDLLGASLADDEISRRRPAVGIASGLAWTTAGGTLLPVEAVFMPGGGRTILTGGVGDTMRESVQTAITFVRTRLEDIGLEPTVLEGLDVHLHFPSTAVPKDGPSGGLAIAASLISLLANVPVRNDIAMTGEITLHGELLPVGGIREKILAALRLGYREVIVPERNAEDVRRLPPGTLDEIEVHLLSSADRAIEVALEEPEDDGRASRRAPRPLGPLAAKHRAG